MHCQKDDCAVKTFDHGNITVHSVINMDSSIVIRRDLCSRSVHIDLFCKRYADPRSCATAALEVFEAKSYKIHPAFRMA